MSRLCEAQRRAPGKSIDVPLQSDAESTAPAQGAGVFITQPALGAGQSRIRHWLTLSKLIAQFGRAHARQFTYGILSALCVVCARVALPWPIKAVLHNWTAHSTGKKPLDLIFGESIWGHGLLLGGIFFALIVTVGCMDFLERLCFARFSIATVRDLRAAAFRASVTSDAASHAQTGDIIARLVGDTARIKAGMKGFFIHVATNATIILFITGMMLYVDPIMGSIVALGGVLIGWLTWYGAGRMYDHASTFRAKEGKLAQSIHRAMHDDPGEAFFSKVNASSGHHEASLTRVQGLTTWGAYLIYGLTVLLAFWAGAGWVSSGRVSRGEMIVFVLYALMLRGPMIQLVRQGARTGKILACVDRLRATLEAHNLPARPATLSPLVDRIQLRDVLIKTSKRKERRRRLGPLTLDIPAGQSVALIGPPGSGKTTFLRAALGLEKIRAPGSLTWDGVPTSRGHLFLAATEQVGYLPESPVWRRTSLRSLLRLGPSEPAPEQAALLDRVGAGKIIARLKSGLDARIGSKELSSGEQRSIALARVLLSDKPVLLLDGVTQGLAPSKAEKVLGAILDRARGRSVIVTMQAPLALERFDRVIALKKGRVVFDGDAAGYLQAAIDAPEQETEAQQ